MVDAHEMQNRGVKIMHMHSVFLGVHAELIARSVGHAAPDAATGEQLFHYQAPRTLRSSPLTYEVNGTQYVAIGTGIGGGSWTSIPLELTPEKRRPNGGNGLFVFALPKENQ